MVVYVIFVAWLRGDPHFTTSDGKTYTFNGHGEYVLVKTRNPDVEIQVRILQTKDICGLPFQSPYLMTGLNLMCVCFTSSTVILRILFKSMDSNKICGF